MAHKQPNTFRCVHMATNLHIAGIDVTNKLCGWMFALLCNNQTICTGGINRRYLVDNYIRCTSTHITHVYVCMYVYAFFIIGASMWMQFKCIYSISLAKAVAATIYTYKYTHTYIYLHLQHSFPFPGHTYLPIIYLLFARHAWKMPLSSSSGLVRQR